MKKILTAILLLGVSLQSFSEDLLTGDTKLACEAILCLSSSENPSECSPSIAKYFSITSWKFSKTLQKRKDFLNLCPAAEDEGMPSLVNAIVDWAGKCTASNLNQVLQYTYYTTERKCNYRNGCRIVKVKHTAISDDLPAYCSAYFSHAYTDNVNVKYSGTEKNGGKWIEQ